VLQDITISHNQPLDRQKGPLHGWKVDYFIYLQEGSRWWEVVPHLKDESEGDTSGDSSSRWLSSLESGCPGALEAVFVFHPPGQQNCNALSRCRLFFLADKDG
jgi:hypothetical protein